MAPVHNNFKDGAPPPRKSSLEGIRDPESFEMDDASPSRGLLSQNDDLEKQTVVEAETPPAKEGHEYGVSTKVKMICLGLYFLMNLGLTLYNKQVLGHVSCCLRQKWRENY